MTHIGFSKHNPDFKCKTIHTYCGTVLIAHHSTSCLKKVGFLQTVSFHPSRKEKLYSASLDTVPISVVNADYKAPSLILRFGVGFVCMYVCESSNDSPLG
uniref:Uncharacterized protein n=1 Tax=Micrurus paraensis TaxID=1970185 RepID=A0A2D4L2P8_9SAUR